MESRPKFMEGTLYSETEGMEETIDEGVCVREIVLRCLCLLPLIFLSEQKVSLL